MIPADLPIICCPTEVILVDDNPTFSLSLATILQQKYCCKTFHSASNVLNYLSELHQRNSQVNQLNPHTVYTTEEELINKRLTNSYRFQQPGIIIVDFSMPEMNGLALCQEIKFMPCKKILLTGEVNENTAVLAFNQQIIDLFIAKQDTLALELIDSNIKKLQKKFQYDSNQYYAHYHETLPAYLTDNKFHEFLTEICQHYKIIEFYFIHNQQKYIMLDSNAKCYSLKITEQDASECRQLPTEQIYYYQFAEYDIEKHEAIIAYQSLLEQQASLDKKNICDEICLFFSKEKFDYFVEINEQLIALSKREAQVFYYLLNGKTAKKTAEQLYLSPRTVEVHIDKIKKKTAMRSKLELLANISITNLVYS